MKNNELVAGVDEAGRGPLAGPVIAAAVILDDTCIIDGLRDSKKLSEARREVLYETIKEHALAWAVGRVDHEQIDQMNILRATLLAMETAINQLTPSPTLVLVDGNKCPPSKYPIQAIVRGDQTVPAIMAASIIAKVTRDREMREIDKIYPGYGFAKHKGYGTKMHKDALLTLGPCPNHRKSFAPVSNMIET